MARYALVIGITQNISPLDPLTHTRADAEAIANVLRAVGDFRVEVLVTPEETTYQALGAKLGEFLERQASRHEALIYYSGHGFQLVDALGEMQAFLAPSDCVVEFGGDRKIVKQQNGLSLSSLGSSAAKAEFSNLVMLLDCCHSFLLEESLLKQAFASFRQKNYWLMTACRSSQIAYARSRDPYSIFTGAVLAGLRRDRSDNRGQITAGELFNFVTKALRNERQDVMQLSVGRPIVMVNHRATRAIPAATVDETNPYQGLLPFTRMTEKFFFGRESEVQTLVQKVQDCNFVPIIGASGSGKSSLVKAGLIPRLSELGWRVLEPMQPGAKPLEVLKLLVGGLFESTQRQEIDGVLDRQELGAIVSRLPDREPILLVVDQFEEVFTLYQEPQERQQFIDCLMSVKQSSNRRLVVVTTMRADFVESCLASKVLTESIQHDAIFLGALAGKNLEDAIVKPALKQGYTVEPGLLQQFESNPTTQ
jgi:Caspase domain